MTDSMHPIRQWRTSQDPVVSQVELGIRVGTSGVNISRIENGDQPVSDVLLPKFVEVTGIPAAVLRPDLAKLFETETTQ